MTAEQQQLLDELKKIELADKGQVGTVAWRAAEEIKSLISAAEQAKTKPH